jgi:uroporphyrinogen decarboxylase
MMTSLDLVRRAIRFEGPERLPFTGSMGETDFSGDTVAIFPDFGLKWWLGGGGTDEWGCLWEVMPDTADMGQVKNVVLPDITNHPSLKIPDVSDAKRYAAWSAILDRAEQEEKYVVVCNGPCIFERAHFLHGFTETLMDTATRPESMREFLRHVVRYHLETVDYIRQHFHGRIHGYRVTDDWGTQSGPLVSPESFRTVFQPVYRELFDAVHEAGMDAWLHSCGNNLRLIPHLIEAGVNVLNLMQPNVFPIPRLADFKGRVCFEVCADWQFSLSTGNRQAIAADIQALLDACCAEKGGLIEERLDQMYCDSTHLDPDVGAFCHAEYRKRDPFVRLIAS